ncbi:MAG: hypothetical protein KTR31_22155 [Myxococcales bacterium]|nr:hypothetical protein [Myxococcales bacterium]
MTCEDVREQLLEASSDFGDLAGHLAGCPSCAALAAAIRAEEQQLIRAVEEFSMSTALIDAQWAEAERRVGRLGGAWRAVHTWLLAAAVVAAILVAGLSGGGRGPVQPPVALMPPPPVLELRERAEAFSEVKALAPVAAGTSREEEDVLLENALKAAAASLQALEDQAVAVAKDEGTDPRWVLEARMALAAGYAKMAQVIADFPFPSYLTEAQHEVYEMAIEDRVFVQRSKAAKAYGAAATYAEKHGLDATEAKRQQQTLLEGLR